MWAWEWVAQVTPRGRRRVGHTGGIEGGLHEMVLTTALPVPGDIGDTINLPGIPGLKGDRGTSGIPGTMGGRDSGQ